jgi:hypothetical protein
MTNATFSVVDGILTIKVNLNERHGMSGSGKNQIISTTSGIVNVPGAEFAKIGLNIFTKDKIGG